jgi:hypothetical protein
MVACSRRIPLHRLGFSAHPLWTVTPAWELGRAAGGRNRGLALMHALDRFKQRQSRKEVPNVPALDERRLPLADAAASRPWPRRRPEQGWGWSAAFSPPRRACRG